MDLTLQFLRYQFAFVIQVFVSADQQLCSFGNLARP